MPLLVMKFGGTSVADIGRIANAAAKVRREVERGYDVIVIVSAMAGKTNELVALFVPVSIFCHIVQWRLDEVGTQYVGPRIAVETV